MAEWRVTEDITGSSIWDGDRPIGTVDKDVAHRMAAAQEMLAALEAAAKDPGLYLRGVAIETRFLIRDAIAKAKGE